MEFDLRLAGRLARRIAIQSFAKVVTRRKLVMPRNDLVYISRWILRAELLFPVGKLVTHFGHGGLYFLGTLLPSTLFFLPRALLGVLSTEQASIGALRT